MKLLVFTEYFPTNEHADLTGGVESRAFHLLRELAKKHDITVVCSYQGKQRRIDRIAGITVIRVGIINPYSNNGNLLSRLVYACSATLTGILLPKIDVIDGYSYLNYPVASLVGAIRQKPVNFTYHECWSFRSWIQLKGLLTGTLGWLWTRFGLALPFASAIAVSETTKKQLCAAGVPAKKVSVVYNGVDIATFGAVKGKPLPFSICTSSRLILSKRIDVLIRAIGLLKKQFPAITLTINGDGAERKKLEQLILKLKLQNNIQITGRIAKFDRVLTLRKKHQLFCLPSEVEGFGMVVIEALASGIPTVCADIPVMREITCGGKGVLLFQPGNAHDLAEKIRTLFTDKESYARLQREAKGCVARYDWVRIAAENEHIYRKVLRA